MELMEHKRDATIRLSKKNNILVVCLCRCCIKYVIVSSGPSYRNKSPLSHINDKSIPHVVQFSIF